jgi:ubiquinone/menaquinone biosynthesis C-methylase UbiE
VVEQLGFADGSFQVVLSTMMMHHLPEELKRRAVSEIARVLQSGGRMVTADFMRAEKPRGARPGLDVFVPN